MLSNFVNILDLSAKHYLISMIKKEANYMYVWTDLKMKYKYKEKKIALLVTIPYK